jgi:CRISPR-associated endonuclease/helicase Cas3
MTASYLLFWGKAGGVQNDEPAWHPNAYHCLDVAAAADTLLLASPRKLVMIAQLLGTSPDNARRLLVCLVALHDVGKFASHFQNKVPEAWPTGVLGAIENDAGKGARHDQTGFELRDALDFKTLLAPAFEKWEFSSPDTTRLWAAVAGHHGRPVDRGGSQKSNALESRIRRRFRRCPLSVDFCDRKVSLIVLPERDCCFEPLALPCVFALALGNSVQWI